jgi:hypothetical protein
VTLGAPLDTPQREVTAVQVRPSFNVVPTLIGAPVAARTVARIDYGTIVSRTYNFGNGPFTFTAPDMLFAANYNMFAGNPNLAPTPYQFTLVPRGMFGQALDGASIGPRFLIAKAVLKKGSFTIANDPVTSGILFDTGNTTTAVTEDGARSLGIDPVNDVPVDCFTINSFNGQVQVKGFMIDKFEMTTSDNASRYVIRNPLVYVHPDLQNPQRPAFPDGISVVIGSNYFAPRTVVFDGPGSVLRTSSAFSIADVNESGQVDCADMAIVKASFGKRAGQVGFDERADVNRDGIVNISDLAYVSQRLPAGTRC